MKLQSPKLIHWAGHSIWYDHTSADLYYRLEFVKTYRTLAAAKNAAMRRTIAIRKSIEKTEE